MKDWHGYILAFIMPLVAMYGIYKCLPDPKTLPPNPQERIATSLELIHKDLQEINHKLSDNPTKELKPTIEQIQ